MITDLYNYRYSDATGVVTLEVTYETTTLILQQANYNNQSAFNAEIVLAGPVATTYPCPAGTSQTVDLASHNIQLVQQTITYKGSQRTVTTLPSGETMQFVWPVT